jgi:hypothetical protein
MLQRQHLEPRPGVLVIWPRGGSNRKSPLPTFTPLLRVTQPLPSNGCFSGSTVLALTKYATLLSESTPTVYLNSIHLLVLVMEMQCVFCEVVTKLLNVIEMSLGLLRFGFLCNAEFIIMYCLRLLLANRLNS